MCLADLRFRLAAARRNVVHSSVRGVKRGVVHSSVRMMVLLAGLMAGAGGAGAAPPSPAAGSGLALPADASVLRQECNSGRPHVEIRACMVARAKANTLEVEQAEEALREALSRRAETLPHLKRSAAQFDAATKAHARWRLQHCEVIAGLAVGQGPQREQRLGCVHDLNLRRLQQLQQLRQALP